MDIFKIWPKGGYVPLTRERGITESVQLLRVKSMHHCADVHNAMCSLTGLQHRSSEQHYYKISHVKRDNSDLQKLVTWFDIHDPFQPNYSAAYHRV